MDQRTSPGEEGSSNRRKTVTAVDRLRMNSARRQSTMVSAGGGASPPSQEESTSVTAAIDANDGGLEEKEDDVWVAALVQGTGEYHYYNRLTGEVTWEKPTTDSNRSEEAETVPPTLADGNTSSSPRPIETSDASAPRPPENSVNRIFKRSSLASALFQNVKKASPSLPELVNGSDTPALGSSVEVSVAVSDGDNGTMEDASKELTPQMQQDYGTSSGLDEKDVPAAGGGGGGGGGGEEEGEEERQHRVASTLQAGARARYARSEADERRQARGDTAAAGGPTFESKWQAASPEEHRTAAALQAQFRGILSRRDTGDRADTWMVPSRASNMDPVSLTPASQDASSPLFSSSDSPPHSLSRPGLVSPSKRTLLAFYRKQREKRDEEGRAEDAVAALDAREHAEYERRIKVLQDALSEHSTRLVNVHTLLAHAASGRPIGTAVSKVHAENISFRPPVRRWRDTKARRAVELERKRELYVQHVASKLQAQVRGIRTRRAIDTKRLAIDVALRCSDASTVEEAEQFTHRMAATIQARTRGALTRKAFPAEADAEAEAEAKAKAEGASAAAYGYSKTAQPPVVAALAEKKFDDGGCFGKYAHCVSFRPRWRRWHETRRRKEELQACVSFRPRWRRWRETRRLRASAERTQKEKTNPTASAAALVPAAGGGNAAPPDLTVTIPNGQKETRTAKKEKYKVRASQFVPQLSPVSSADSPKSKLRKRVHKGLILAHWADSRKSSPSSNGQAPTSQRKSKLMMPKQGQSMKQQQPPPPPPPPPLPDSATPSDTTREQTESLFDEIHAFASEQNMSEDKVIELALLHEDASGNINVAEFHAALPEYARQHKEKMNAQEEEEEEEEEEEAKADYADDGIEEETKVDNAGEDTEALYREIHEATAHLNMDEEEVLDLAMQFEDANGQINLDLLHKAIHALIVPEEID
jgi:hypothetical protein